MITAVYGFSQDVVKIEVLGTNPLFRGGVTSIDHMRETFMRSPAEMRKSLELAGQDYIVEEFLQQFRNVEVEETLIAVGDILPWMVYRKRGKISVIQNVQWMGKEPIDAFAFSIIKEDTRYNYVVPKKCGNLSFWDSEKLPRLTCDIRVSPQKANMNDTFSVDMSNTKNANEIKIKVLDEHGNELQRKDISINNPVFNISFDKPGYYTFKVHVNGIETYPLHAECETRVYVNYPPECDLESSSEEIILSEKLVLDASGSSDPDGSIERASFEIIDKDGNIVMTDTITSKPFILEPDFSKPSIYTINLVVYDDMDASSEVCSVRVEIRPRTLYYIELAPSLVYGSYTYNTAIRGGLLYRIIPHKLDLKLGAGFGMFTTSRFNHYFMANAALHLNFGDFFIGTGLGYSTKYMDYLERKTLDVLHGEPMEAGMDVLFTAGYNILKDKGTIFGEVRVPFGGNRKFDEQHIFLAGFTYYF